MRLTRFTDLALRVLMRLAVADADLPTTRDVAATMEVPYTHSAKVVARLRHLGLIEARRGRGGGLALTAAGRAASVGGVVRELEGAGDVVDCDGAVPLPAARRVRPARRAARGPGGVLRRPGPPDGERPGGGPDRAAAAGHFERPAGADRRPLTPGRVAGSRCPDPTPRTGAPHPPTHLPHAQKKYAFQIPIIATEEFRMLSEKSTETVRATLPAVGAAIGDIAELFYAKLFTAHPALLRDLFNRGNQNSGAQKQALAGSIAAFATHLLADPGTRPDVMLNRIAHKHASLGITREQYEVVHHHLFEAIAEILGEAVTPEVAEAWDEVYWLMAGALVAIEDRLYAERRVLAGDVWRDWRIAARFEETADCATFHLVPADGAPAPAFAPGQYVSVQVELPDGARQIRQYSLSRSPGSAVRAITVKRVHGPAAAGPDGEVSHHLHTRVRTGDTLRVSAPYGDLVLRDSGAPVLLASAGIGCTPMLSMLEHLADTGHTAPVTVLHADRSPRRPRAARRPPEPDAQAAGRLGPVLVRGGRRAGRLPRPPRPDGRPGRARHHRVPVRAAPVHAGRTYATAGQGGPRRGHPLRGVRPGPLAGSRVTPAARGPAGVAGTAGTGVRIGSLAVRIH
ncbi:hypothetical protein GCM10020254_31510 [Streptomyces goshikiensis]